MGSALAKYFDVNPDLSRLIPGRDLVDSGRSFINDSCFALGAGCNRSGLGASARSAGLTAGTISPWCAVTFAARPVVQVDNAVFRLVKAATPGSYTFILPATREVPRQLMHPKKRTVGVRVTSNRVAQALVAELGEPLVSSTLLLPGDSEPMTQGWDIKERLDHQVDAVVDAGECGTVPTTVVDLSEGEPEILRIGAGDPARFE
jgi:hypothetical protein